MPMPHCNYVVLNLPSPPCRFSRGSNRNWPANRSCSLSWRGAWNNCAQNLQNMRNGHRCVTRRSCLLRSARQGVTVMCHRETVHQRSQRVLQLVWSSHSGVPCGSPWAEAALPQKRKQHKSGNCARLLLMGTPCAYMYSTFIVFFPRRVSNRCSGGILSVLSCSTIGRVFYRITFEEAGPSRTSLPTQLQLQAGALQHVSTSSVYARLASMQPHAR